MIKKIIEYILRRISNAFYTETIYFKDKDIKIHREKLEELMGEEEYRLWIIDKLNPFK